MLTFGAERVQDAAILVARVLLVVLFVLFGWDKLTHYDVTAGFMAQTGLPMPGVTAVVVIVLEFFVGLAVAFGVATRPLALLLAVYTLGTGLVAHHYWDMTGAAVRANEINFYKNVSIVAGFLLLYVTGAGRYSVDAALLARRGGASRIGLRSA